MEKKSFSASRPRIPLECLKCGEFPPIKNNESIHEELQRMLSGIPATQEASCPDAACSNHDISISVGKQHYSAFGKSSAGASRYKCKSCGKVFNVSKSTSGQRLPHKNRLVFSLLVNKTPFKLARRLPF